MIRRCVVALAALFAATTLRAQNTPEALAALVMQKFSSGAPDEFAKVYPDSAGRVFMREGRGARVTELSQVVWKGPKRAVLLLGGVVRPNATTVRDVTSGGNETNGARHFSGFYEAVESDGLWAIARQIPLDSLNVIRSQQLVVDLVPTTGITVVDTLGISVGASHGFAARLNNAVKLDDVRLDGKPVEHSFRGGVVWVNAPRSTRAKLVLTYSLAAPNVKPDSTPAFGAFHNTDVWHPFFDYLSANNMAQITATVRVPAEYYLTTTIPQTDAVRNGTRTVRATSKHGEFLLALIYDRDWRPRSTNFGAFTFESFALPGFRHTHDSLAAVTKRVYDVLTPRFGEPQAPSRYLAAVQNRLLGAGGFNVRMNNAAMSGAGGGGELSTKTSQVFAHETAHAWTMNGSGRAANFIREAWATFSEALMYRALFTKDDERAFWERQRNSYMVGEDRRGFAGGFEGQQSILANYDNGRIHYRKGVWIFGSGEWAMGQAAFDRGMRDFVAGMGNGRRGYEELIAAWSKAAGRDMTSFVMPWLSSKYIPNVAARVDGDRLIVTQEQPGELFALPKLEIDVVMAAGTIRKTVNLTRRADTVRVESSLSNATQIRVDPDRHYLLQRHWGEPSVRFELPASKVPEKSTVTLAGNFLRTPMPATKNGDAWIVELPMTEGQYVWLWQIADSTGRARVNAATMTDSTMTGTRTVRPLERVTNAYPGR